jgi:hypothetical protein
MAQTAESTYTSLPIVRAEFSEMRALSQPMSTPAHAQPRRGEITFLCVLSASSADTCLSASILLPRFPMACTFVSFDRGIIMPPPPSHCLCLHF